MTENNTVDDETLHKLNQLHRKYGTIEPGQLVLGYIDDIHLRPENTVIVDLNVYTRGPSPHVEA